MLHRWQAGAVEEAANEAHRILAMAESTPRLERLLAEAQRQALRQREAAEVDSLVSRWSDGEWEKTLVAYAGLNTSQRERVRTRIQNPHLTWMETAPAAPGAVKPLKLARAVLALGQYTDMLHSGADPQQVIAQLRIHEKILQHIPQAREILLQAETQLKTLEEKNRKRFLEEAEAFLAVNDFSMAWERIEQLKALGLDEAGRQRLEPLKKRIFHFRKIQTLRKRYEDSVDRKEEVTSRRLADRLARLPEGGSAQFWADRVAEHSAAIRTQWCLSTAEILDLPGCYGSLGLDSNSDMGSCLLLPGGRQVLIATAHDRWAFLRTFDLNDPGGRPPGMTSGVLRNLDTIEKTTSENLIDIILKRSYNLWQIASFGCQLHQSMMIGDYDGHCIC